MRMPGRPKPGTRTTSSRLRSFGTRSKNRKQGRPIAGSMEKVFFVLTLLAALGSGLIAGVFFVFSVAIMRALERIPPGVGMWSMQSINIYIFNWKFLGVFLGTGVLCGALAIVGVVQWRPPASVWLIAGGLIYPIGSNCVTSVLNVPMNNSLMSADPATPRSEKRRVG